MRRRSSKLQREHRHRALPHPLLYPFLQFDIAHKHRSEMRGDFYFYCFAVHHSFAVVQGYAVLSESADGHRANQKRLLNKTILGGCVQLLDRTLYNSYVLHSMKLGSTLWRTRGTSRI